MAADGAEWDDDWLQAEIARELAACNVDDGADTNAVADESGACTDGSDTDQPSANGPSALEALEAYMRERSERNTQVERALEEDLVSVSQLAGRVQPTPEPWRTPSGPLPGPEPEPEPEPRLGTEPEPVSSVGGDDDSAEVHAAYAAHLRAANAEDQQQRLARLRQAFDSVQGQLVEFPDEKLAVGTDLAPKPAAVEADGTSAVLADGSLATTPQKPAMDLAEMVAQAAREAEAWADEEEARVMQEVRDEAAGVAQAEPDGVGDHSTEAEQDASVQSAVEGAAGAADDDAAAADAERRRVEELEQRKREAAQHREQELAERKAHEEARQRDREAAEQARREAAEREEQEKSERRWQEEAEELERQQAVAAQQAKRALERERENAQLQQLLQEQLAQQEIRHKKKVEAEAEMAHHRETAEMTRAAAAAAVAEKEAQLEAEARAAEEAFAQQQEEAKKAAERELQVRMEAIARQNAELAQRQAQLAEEQEAMRLAAQEREERERQRAQEAAEQKAKREAARRAREKAWARNDELLKEFDAACKQRSAERLSAVLLEMDGNATLADKASEGKALLQRWEEDVVSQLRSALDTAHASRDLSGLREAVTAAAGCTALDTEVARSEICIQAWELIDARSVDRLREFTTDLQRKGSLGPDVQPVEAECRSCLAGWDAEPRLQVALAEARSKWDGDRLEQLCVEIEKYGPALLQLAEECRTATKLVQEDAALCERLQEALASSDRLLRVDALRCAAATEETGVASAQLEKLKAQVKNEVEFLEEEEGLKAKMNAARGRRDRAALKVLLVNAGNLVAKSASVGTEIAAREGGIVAAMGVAQEHMKCWTEEDRILQRIEAAVAARDEEELRAALGQSTTLGHHNTVVTGQQTLALWKRQRDICVRLSNARATENRSQIEEALSEAVRDETLSCPALGVELDSCRQLLQSMDECSRAQDVLEHAMQQGSPDSLRTAIATAHKFLSLKALVVQAEQLLSTAERSGALERSLISAMERRSLYDLRPLVEPAKSEGLAIANDAMKCMRQLESEERARQELVNALADCDSAKLFAVTQRICADAQLSSALRSELSMAHPSLDLAARSYTEIGKRITSADGNHHEVAAGILYARPEPALEQLSQWQATSSDIVSAPDKHMMQDSEDELEELKLEMGLEELDAVPDIDNAATLLSLNLKVNKIKDAAGLGPCVALRELLLNDNQIEALGEITKLTKLRQLSIDMNRLKSLDQIGSCSCLRILSANNNAIGSVAPLGDCPELEKVTLYRNQVADLKGLSNLRWLQHLDLGRNALKAIDGLGECPVLQTLVLYENQITYISPDVLKAPMLRELWLSGNPVKSLDFAQWLPSLEHLHLSDAEVEDISPLANCGLLQTLDLSFNKVADLLDLAALSACPLMRVLRLNDNPVATQPGYKEILISALPALCDLDNEAVNDLRGRMKHSQRVFTGSTKVNGSPLRSAWWLNDKTGDVDWQRVLRPESCEVSAASRNDVWATRTFRHACLLQRDARAQLVREEKRELRMLEANNKRLGGSHGVILAAREESAAQVRTQLQEQHNSQRHFTAESCQNILVKNSVYSRRIDHWREHTACVTVQSRWRGWYCRHQVHLRRSHAAVTIQMRWCAHIANVRNAAGGPEAVRIQAMFRGHHVRRRLKHALESAKYIGDDDDDLLAVDEDQFAVPGDLDTVWVPDMRASLELGNANGELDSVPRMSAQWPETDTAAEPLLSGSHQEVSLSDVNTNARQGERSRANHASSRSTGAWDAPLSNGNRNEDTSPVFPSLQTPPRQVEQDLQEPSPTGTARSVRHADRVAGMFDRMRDKEQTSTIVNEWGLSNPETIAALKKKAQRTRRHDHKVKAKKATAAQRLEHYRATQGSSGWSDASGSVRSTPAPSPTPPMSARSDSRMNSSLVRRVGSSAPPSPATSSMSETGGLQQFNSGQPNQRAARDLASRGSSAEPRQPTPKTQTNNFLQPTPAAATPAAASAPWGMAAQAKGGRVSAPVVSRGANAQRKKVKKHAPRVAGLAR